jgi:16S rRNA (uracil1498-N3)-methyltransferase
MTRRFRADEIPAKGESTTLSREVSHHLLTVCLTPRGSKVRIFDGAGAEASGTLAGVSDGLAVITIDEILEKLEAGRDLILIQGMPRKPALERIVRMATELGVTEIRCFIASRTVANKAHTERWQSIATSSAAQCGRDDLPTITTYKNIEEATKELPAGDKWVLSPKECEATSNSAPVALLIGPEGGLTDEEMAVAIDAGFSPENIAPYTLRSDTAAVAALTLAINFQR